MMGGRLIYGLSRLSERERGLLLILTVVVVPIALAFLVVMPLLEARKDARQEAFGAQALLGWVADRVGEMPAETEDVQIGFAQPDEPMGISAIEESLVRIDLRDFVTQLANAGEGGVDLTLEAAPFERLSDWLLAMTPRWGYDILSYRIEASDPGLVNAAFELEPAQ